MIEMNIIISSSLVVSHKSLQSKSIIDRSGIT